MRDAPFVSAYWTPETTDNFTLGIFGNANEDVPLTYEERDEGNKKPATNLAADANYDGEINRLDAEQAKLIIQGRRSLRLELSPSTSKSGDRP